jgi:hypothetical protein
MEYTTRAVTKLLLALVAVLLLPGAVCGAREDAPLPPAPVFPPAFTKPPPGERALVIYTASVQGYVEPCGCTADPLGGVARLKAAIDDAERAYDGRVLFVDAGDTLFEKPTDNAAADACQAKARIALLLDSQVRAGLRATVLGPLDDVRGAEFRDERIAARKIVTLGVPDAGRALTSGAELRSSLLDERTKVAVVGFRADDDARADAVRLALLSEVGKLQAQGARAIVALAQSPRALTRKIVSGTAIDVVIQGRAPGEVPVAPERLPGPEGAAAGPDGAPSGPVLVASGQQAQNAGVIELVLEGRAPGAPLALDDREADAARKKKLLDVRITELKIQVRDMPEGAKREFLAARLAAQEQERAALDEKIEPMTGPHIVARALPLVRGMGEDPQARVALDDYTKQIPSLVAQCEANAVCPPPAEGQQAYVGALVCKGCHVPAYEFWQQQRVTGPGKDKAGRPIERTMSHAHAWQTLVVDGKHTDRACVACHATGFDEPGGVCKTSEIEKRGLANVQCESCHGPGSVHAKTTNLEDVRMPTEETCRACHHVPHIETSESFVWSEKRRMIIGPGHGAPKEKAR